MWENPLPTLRKINSSPIARRFGKTGPAQDRQTCLDLKRLDDVHLPTLKITDKDRLQLVGAEPID